MLTLDSVYRASYALRDVVRKTHVIHAPKLKAGADLYLKTENLQITGSFKVRGAYYKMTRLTEEEKARGVITRKIPSDAGSFKVYYRNTYGIWTHPLTPIEK